MGKIKSNPKIRPSPPRMEELEPRILYSADFAPEVVPTLGGEPVVAEHRVVDFETEIQLDDFEAATGEYDIIILEESDLETVDTAVLSNSAEQFTYELVIVDTATPDYQQLIDDILAQNTDANLVEVVLLDASRDGIEQLTDILSGYSGLDAVHLISHGSDGAVSLGNTILNNETLLEQAANIESWSGAFSEEGDFLIYGCNLAITENGQTLVDSIAELTGADVAASDDLTGSAERGGDWELEYTVGTIESDIAISVTTQLAWNGMLGTTSGLVGHWTFDSDATDASTPAYDGVLGGDASIDTSAGTNKIGAGKLVLDGAGDYVDLDAHISNFSGLNEGTISAWINLTDAGENMIFSLSDESTSTTFVKFGVQGGKLKWFNTASVVEYSTQDTLNDGSWHHVSVTVNASGNTLYIDGQLEGTDSNSSFFSNISNADAVDIGRTMRSSGASYEFDGLLDDVRVYNRALTTTDINALFLGSTNTVPTAANNTVSTSEDTDYTFPVSDFNFNGAGSLASIKITMLESVGSLQLSGTDVALDQVISAADITAGNLKFIPIANASGSAYDSFSFSVNDGTDDSASSYTMILNVDAVNDAPTLIAAPSSSIYTAGFAPQDLYYSVSINTIEASQTIEELVITVSGVKDGADEIINFDGTSIALVAGSGATTSNNYSVSISGETATVTLTTTGTSVANAETLVDGLSYQHNNGTLTGGNRLIEITSITDSGGSETSNPGVSSTISVVPNTAPTDLIISGALNLDGSWDAITVPGVELDNNIITAFTVEMEIRPAQINASGWSYHLVHQYSDGPDADSDGWNENGFYLTINDGKLDYAQFDSGTHQGGATSAGGELKVGTWQTVTVTRNASNTVVIYLDGVQVATGSAPSIIGSTGVLTFLSGFEGDVREIRVFDTALNSGEVTTSQTTNYAGTEANLILLYDFEEGSGSALFDQNTPNYNGTLANPAATNWIAIQDIAENSTAGAVVGFLSADDPDANDTLTYSIVNDPSNNFKIVGREIQVNTGATLDFESASSHDITIRVTDSGSSGLSYDEVVTIQVTDVNEAPIVDLNDNSNPTGIDFNQTWTKGGGSVLITDADSVLNDVEGDKITSLIVTLTNPSDGANEILVADTSGTYISTNQYDSTTGVLTLSGTDSAAHYQQVLRTITYNNTQATPYSETRVIEFVAKDLYNASSLVATTNLTVSTDVGVLIVTNTSDTVDNINGSTTAFSIDDLIANPGIDGISLREAIIASNNTANKVGGADVIRFDVTGVGPHSINITTALPEITQAITIDGTSEPDFVSTPMIELNGTGTAANENGLTLGTGSNGSAIRGLVINRFGGNGIEIRSDSNIIEGNYIGTGVNGTTDLGNGDNGILVRGGDGNLIGGITADTRNIISGNTQAGITLYDSASNNKIKGNYIGTIVSGLAPLSNKYGIFIGNVSNGNIIGTDQDGVDDANEGNLISGNTQDGIALNGAGVTGNTVAGNKIGVNTVADAPLGNGRQGIWITFNAHGNTVGGATTDARNIISGNISNGIHIGTNNNKIQGNYIGTNSNGTLKIANGENGIVITSGSTNIVGTDLDGTNDTTEGNLISGNTKNGISLGGTASNNSIRGNLIGVNASALGKLSNDGEGIEIGFGASNNIIGGTHADAANTISGNVKSGIYIRKSTTTDNKVQGNFIGTNSGGSLDLGNTERGVFVNNAPNNLIGGVTAGAGNTIAFNNIGINIYDNDPSPDNVDAVNNSLLRNSIYSNKGLGIKLGQFWDSLVTENDPGDVDTGQNNLQNFPILTSATITTTGVSISGSLNSIAAVTDYRIELFASATEDETGHGEAERYLGYTNITTDAAGNVTFTNIALTETVTTGEYITATATRTDGTNFYDTSEFAENITATFGIGTIGDTTVVDNTAFTSVTPTLIGTPVGTVTYSLGGLDAALFSVDTGTGVISMIARDYETPEDNGGDNIYNVTLIATDSDTAPNIAEKTLTVTVINTVTVDTLSDDPANSDIIEGDSTHTIEWLNTHKGSDGKISLREAIIAANNANGTNAINFSVAGIINLTDGLPKITEAIVIDGSIADVPGIELNGSAAGASVNGLELDTGSNGSTIKGLVINNFSLNGLKVLSNNNTIIGNYIGTNSAGTAALANTEHGIHIFGDNNTIGGTETGERNVISGNTKEGVYLQGADNNVIQGNYIGTDATGLLNITGTAEVNGSSGISITSGSTGNLVGTDGNGTKDSAERNVISGNNWFGVEFVSSSTMNNTVAGNYIGTDKTGNAALGNSHGGVSFYAEAYNNVVGGDAVAERNIISSNQYGIIINAGSSTNKVQGNYIGLGEDGTTELGNSLLGIYLNDSDNAASVNGNIIGTDGDGTNDGSEGNVISANGRGIEISGIGVTNTIIAGNYIGTDANGAVDKGNTSGNTSRGQGIYITNSNGHTIGGDTIDERNVISGNQASGIELSDASNITIQGNLIGTDVTGTLDLGNTAYGIYLVNSVNTLVGGSTASARNIISGNNSSGIGVFNGSSTANTIQGNYIGTDISGTSAIANTYYGVRLSDSDANTIKGNLISGNTTAGINLETSAQNNTIQNNQIGLKATGSGFLSNGFGIRIGGGSNNSNNSNNLIGGTNTGDENEIAGNNYSGIAIISATNIDNTLLGNLIHNNNHLGIDLGANGVTNNDGNDIDTGANNLQNLPVITNVTTNGTEVFISGALNSTPSTNYRIEFFASTSATADGSGYGEAERYLGSANVTTNASGNITFTNITFTKTVTVGEHVTATATVDLGGGNYGDTSEFAQNKVVIGPDIIITPTTGLTTTEDGGTATFDVVLNAAPTANVTINLSVDDSTEGSLSSTSLVFTAANWNTAQTVTVTGLPDTLNDGDIAYLVITAAATSADTNYNGINPSDVSLTNTEGVNADPGKTGSLPTDITVTEDVSGNVDLSSITLTDPDAGSSDTLTLTLTTSTGGNLTAAASAGITAAGSGTATLTLTGTLTDLNTYLDTAANIKYLHSTAHTNGDNADTIKVEINDNGNTGAGGGTDIDLGTVNVDITAVNDAPVIASGTYSLPAITEDDIDNAGQTVQQIIDSAGGSGISDVDGDPDGITIIINNENTGTWQYSIDAGSNWIDVGTVSGTSGLLLRNFDLVRLQPNGVEGTPANFGFRAWDQTIGTAGTKVNVSPVGGTSAFSNATETANISVSDINDAPTITKEALFTDSGQSLGGSSSLGIDIGDIDGDGDVDMVYSQANKVFLNDGSGNYTDTGQNLGNSNSTAIALGDIDGDGDLDMVVGNYTGFISRVYINDGTGSFTDDGIGLGHGNTTSVELGDLDGDGDLDIVLGNFGEGNKVFTNNGTGTFTDNGQSLGSENTRSIALGDIDNDGDLDLISGDQSLPNKVYLNDGSGDFTTSAPANAGATTNTYGVTIGDIDGDGDLDLIEANYGSANKILINDGSGNFVDTGQALGGASTSRAVAVGDLDNDGDLDLIFGNSGGPNSVFINDGSGNYTGQNIGNADSSAIHLADVDADGDLDIIVGNNNGVANKVFINDSTISSLSTLALTEGDSAQPLTSVSIIADIDSADFDGGNLSINYSVTGDSGDQLSINHQGASAGQIGFDGTNVSYAGVTIGTLNTPNNGVNGNAFLIDLNSNATPVALTALLNNITFQNTSDNPTASRTLSITVKDGDGGTSAAITQIITVASANDPPHLVGDNIVVNGTFDNDSSNWTTSGNLDVSSGEVRFGQVGGPNGSLSQTISTTIGETYFITFSYGDRSTTNIQSIRLNVDGNTSLFNTELTSGVAENSLHPYTFTFVADSTSTTISLTDTSASHGGVRGYLDDVAVRFDATPAATIDYTENDAPKVVRNSLYINDLDDNQIEGASVQVTGNYANGEDRLNFTNQNGITGVWTAISGTLTLTGSAILADYEAALKSITYENSSDAPDTSTRTVSISITDGESSSNILTQDFNVISVNDAPTTTGLADITVTEDAADSVVNLSPAFADVEDLDPDLTYTLEGNTNSGLFSTATIDGVAGTLTLDYAPNENGSSDITIRATDTGGKFIESTFTVTVNADNDTPTIANLIPDQTATEDDAFSFQFAANTFDDVDVGDTLTYTSNASGWLVFDLATRTFSGTPVNGDVGTTMVTVTADDSNGGTVTDSFNIVISNTNDAPSINDAIFTLDENSPHGAAVGTVPVSDPDVGDTHVYSIIDGNTGSAFAINNEGNLTVANSSALDFEANAVFNLTIEVEDSGGVSGLTDFATITVNLNDVDEFDVAAIIDSNTAADRVAEDAGFGDTVGLTALAADRDGTATVSYSLTDDADGQFAIDPTTGVVTVNAELNAETATSHSISVTATSTDNSTSTQAYTITVTDVNEFGLDSVADIDAAENTVSEDAAIGSVVGITFAGQDKDQSDSVTYHLIDDAGGLFSIDPDTGVITVAGELDYERSPTLTLTVSAESSDGSVVQRDFLVLLKDVYDQAPPDTDTPSDDPDTSDPDDELDPPDKEIDPGDVPVDIEPEEVENINPDAASGDMLGGSVSSLFKSDDPDQQLNVLARGQSRGAIVKERMDTVGIAPEIKSINAVVPSDVWRLNALDIQAQNGQGYIPHGVHQTFVTTGAFILPINPDVPGESKEETIMSTAKLTAAATGLTVGSILWLLRSGGLMAISLLFYPAWRNVDPLPVLVAGDDEEDEMEEEDDVENDLLNGEKVGLLTPLNL